MTKIYERIFPIEADQVDNVIYQNCVRLSWVEPKHIIKGRAMGFNYSTFLPEAVDCFKRIESEKSPRKKLEYVNKIFSGIVKTFKFNDVTGDAELGVDDYLPVLNYACIKARPQKLHTNIKFIDLYIEEKERQSQSGQNLIQMTVIAKTFENFTFNEGDMPGITKEMYVQLCNDASMGKYDKDEEEGL